MKKKQIGLLLMLCTAIGIMTGCSNEAENAGMGKATEVIASEDVSIKEQKEQTASLWDVPETYTKTIENITFDVKVEFPKEWKNCQVYKSKAERITYSKEKIEQVLGKVSYDWETWEENKDGGYLSADDYGVTYFTELGEHITNCVDLDARAGNINQYKKDTDLSFMTRQEAYEKVLHTLSDMGIEMEEVTYTSYALDFETLQVQEYVMDADGSQLEEYKKQDWSIEDECYLFLIRQNVQGAPEYHVYGNAFVRMEEGNAPIQIYYSKNGIERMDIEKGFRITQEEEILTLLDFEEIAQAAVKELNNREKTSSYQLSSAQMCFMTPALGDEMTPVWVFQAEEKTVDGENYPVTVVINAQTGELSAIGCR